MEVRPQKGFTLAPFACMSQGLATTTGPCCKIRGACIFYGSVKVCLQQLMTWIHSTAREKAMLTGHNNDIEKGGERGNISIAARANDLQISFVLFLAKGDLS